jgi:hypothetical protein
MQIDNVYTELTRAIIDCFYEKMPRNINKYVFTLLFENDNLSESAILNDNVDPLYLGGFFTYMNGTV